MLSQIVWSKYLQHSFRCLKAIVGKDNDGHKSLQTFDLDQNPLFEVASIKGIPRATARRTEMSWHHTMLWCHFWVLLEEEGALSEEGWKEPVSQARWSRHSGSQVSYWNPEKLQFLKSGSLVSTEKNCTISALHNASLDLQREANWNMVACRNRYSQRSQKSSKSVGWTDCHWRVCRAKGLLLCLETWQVMQSYTIWLQRKYAHLWFCIFSAVLPIQLSQLDALCKPDWII